MTLPTQPRLPPGQIVTRKWPVLHYGIVPTVALDRWRFAVTGAVERPFELTWAELHELPRRDTTCDIHCVTRWSRYDNVFGGVSVRDILQRAGVRPKAGFALVHAEQGYTTNLPLADLDRPDNLLALTHDGEPLTPEHGGPVRLLVPHLYLWKSAKWVRGFEILEEDPRLLGAERIPHAGRPLGRGALRPARPRAHAQGASIGLACLSHPTRFFCLAWPNHLAAPPPRRRRSSGSRRSFEQRTAGHERPRAP